MTDTQEVSQTVQQGGNHQVDVPADNQQQTTDIWSEEFKVDTLPDNSTNDGGQQAEDNQPEVSQSVDSVDDVNWDSLYKEQLNASDAKLDKPILLKVKGKILEIDNLQDIRDLAERGTAATAKFQEMAEQRKFIQKLESAGISEEDIDLLRRARMGDTEATQQLLAKEAGAEPMPDNVIEAEQVAQEILTSDHADAVKDTLSLIPEGQREQYAYNPQFMRGLKADYDAGIAQKIMPTVEKYVMVKGMPFIEAYAKAGQEVFGNQRQEKAKSLTAKPTVGSSVKKQEPADVWAMGSDAFKNAMSSVRN
jgi:hypothetical protein